MTLSGHFPLFESTSMHIAYFCGYVLPVCKPGLGQKMPGHSRLSSQILQGVMGGCPWVKLTTGHPQSRTPTRQFKEALKQKGGCKGALQ